MEKIKLVIWDLDETFWKGTLSEGEVEIVKKHVEIVKELARRGIISSISSKNDFEPAKAELEKVGVWDYFIFPLINWNPKGENVKGIIEACQLRAPNVLFIDDNISNRKEVEHYNEGINTLSEASIDKMLSMPELKGKDDSKLIRLNQYKILEKKHLARADYSDNKTFLRESEIKIRFIPDCKKYRDRILELINRTNQLNFTKTRLDEGQLDDLLVDSYLKNECIEVRDKFGDYGICGFYSFDIDNNELRHFLFSCRILNLGIESYVYKKLGCPKIEIVKPVAGDLSLEGDIDWIKEVDSFDTIKTSIHNKGRIRVLLLGGCDLEQMCHYVDTKNIDLITEFNYPNKLGVAVHKEHTCYLRSIKELEKDELTEIKSLPFGDEKMFETILFSDNYDVLVYSVLMNYTQDLFKNKEKEYKVAYGGYASKDKAYECIPRGGKFEFSGRFDFCGQQSCEDFIADLSWLHDNISKPIIFINGAEIPDFNPSEPGAYKRHQEMNAALDDFIISHNSSCKLLDVRKYVKTRSDNKDNIRHYQRPIYIHMAEELMTLLSGSQIRVKAKTKLKNRIIQWLRIIKTTIFG